MAPLIAVPDPDEPVYHWYVYGEAPPETDAARVKVCPESAGFRLEDTDTEGSVYTMVVPESPPTFPPKLSVVVMLHPYDVPLAEPDVDGHV